VAGETVAISSPEEIPSTDEFDRRYFEERGVLATIFVPGAVGREIVGVLGSPRVGCVEPWSVHS
jgi:hypothetical protein